MTAKNASIIKEKTDRLLNEMPDEYITDIINHTSEDMVQVQDGSVELIVTSPPYPMVEMWDYLGDYDEQHEMIETVLHECYKKLVDGGIMCINIGDATRSQDGDFKCYPNHAKVQVAAENVGFDSLIPIFWKKPQNSPNKFMGSGMLPPNAYVTNEMEYILIFRKGSKREVDNQLLRKASQYTQMQRNKWFSQVWEVPGESQDDGNAAYPFEIPYRLIRMFSIIGDTVLDPFAGTGTTLMAARALGRNSIGYEVDGDMIPTIREKINEVDSVSNMDILRNYVRVDRDNADAEVFYKNPNALVDIL